MFWFRSNQDISLLVDALAACLFSSKLESVYRYWALKQLLKVFSQVCDKKTRSATSTVILQIFLDLFDMMFFLLAIKTSSSKQLFCGDSQFMAMAYSSKKNTLFSMYVDCVL